MKFSRLCSPRAAALGIVACVLVVAAFEVPAKEVVVKFESSEPIKASGLCDTIGRLAGFGQAVASVNVSTWNVGGWPLWKSYCLYRIPEKRK